LHNQFQSLSRSFQSSALLAGDIKITVPSMGDSISEGTVASVAKQAGKTPGELLSHKHLRS